VGSIKHKVKEWDEVDDAVFWRSTSCSMVYRYRFHLQGREYSSIPCPFIVIMAAVTSFLMSVTIYRVKECYIPRGDLATIIRNVHGVWTGNWIYWTLIARIYKWEFCCYSSTTFTNRCRTHLVFSACYRLQHLLFGNDFQLEDVPLPICPQTVPVLSYQLLTMAKPQQ
jgi:hypothetical protein